MSQATEIIESFQTALEALDGIETDLERDDLAGLSVGLVEVADRLDAMHSLVVRAAEVAGVHEIAGAASITAYGAHKANTAKTRASALACTGRFLAEHDVTADAARSGEISAKHVSTLRSTGRSEPAVESLTDPDTQWTLLGYAAKHRFEDFRRVVRHWESVVDPDGTEERAAGAHERRGFDLQSIFDDAGYVGHVELGNLDGVLLKEAVDRLADEMFHADLAEAREWLGREPNLAELRTPRQRRADALVELVRRGAAVSPSVSGPVPLVELLIDSDTFGACVDWLAGDDDAYDGCDPETRVCETLDGRTVTPTEVAQSAFVGHIRRVVLDADSVVVDMGHKKRLFTGAAREAALIAGRWCDRQPFGLLGVSAAPKHPAGTSEFGPAVPAERTNAHSAQERPKGAISQRVAASAVTTIGGNTSTATATRPDRTERGARSTSPLEAITGISRATPPGTRTQNLRIQRGGRRIVSRVAPRDAV